MNHVIMTGFDSVTNWHQYDDAHREKKQKKNNNKTKRNGRDEKINK